MITRAVMRVVTYSSHFDALRYGLTILVKFENFLYPKVASYMTQFQPDFTSPPTCFVQIFQIRHHLQILSLVSTLFVPSKAIPITFEHLATHYQTLETWIDHTAMRYHALQHALPYIFSMICVVLGNFQWVTTRYHQIYKNIYTIVFKEINGNAW